MFDFSYFIFFLFGLVAGSFLNCLIYRLEIGAGFPFGRSYCPKCKHTLSWQDLIPVLSFLLLKARCRYCREPISSQYPLVEITTGMLFVLVLNYELRIMNYGFFNFDNILNILFLFLVSCFLLIVFVYDLKHYIIPDEIIYPAIITALIFNFQFLIFNEFSIFQFSILSAIGASGFFLLIVLASKGKWMGMGDVKLAFFMGLILGWPNILIALFIAFLIGAIIGLGLILAGRKTLKSEVPFGPFLVAGTFAAVFWGEGLINWYLNLIAI